MLYNTLHDTLPLNVMISGKCFYGLGMAITRFHHQCFCFGCEILHNTKKEKEKENFVSYFVFFLGKFITTLLKKFIWILEGEAFFFPAFYILDKFYKPVTILMLNPYWDACIGRNIRNYK